MNKILIIGGDFSVERIFHSRGWLVGVYNGGSLKFDPDFVLFTGGADISPEIYGEKNTASWPNPRRDDFELGAYQTFKDKKKLGICRGAQLLNCLNEGKMIQDIKGHTGGRHFVKDLDMDNLRKVNSCHHQQIVPSKHVKVVAESVDGLRVPEVIWIEQDQALGIQGHPEWEQPTEDYFFELIERYY